VAFSIEIAKGFRIDKRLWDIQELEVDKDALIRGDLTIKGREIVELTEIHYADVEIRGAKQLIVPPFAGANGLVVRDYADAEDRLRITEGGDVWTRGSLIVPAPNNILGRSYVGTAKTVTETTSTLKDECAPVSPKNVLYPLNVVVNASNPTGSGVTLSVEVKLRHSDDTETTIDSFSAAEGETAKKDYMSADIAKALKEGVSVIGARVYAYCSATPAVGFEPTVTLTSIKALQF